MSHYDSRSIDPSSYATAGGFGGASGYGSSIRSSSSKRDYDVAEPPRKLVLDGLTPFEKNFYVESPSVAAMPEKEVEEYRLQREITVEGRDIPKPVKSFSDVGFPGWKDARNDPVKAVTFGDGEPLPADIIYDCLRILEEECVAVPWQKGDVLLIDNLAVLHSRRPFNPPRRVLASLCK